MKITVILFYSGIYFNFYSNNSNADIISVLPPPCYFILDESIFDSLTLALFENVMVIKLSLGIL
jgi:hypothetical protein